MDWCVAGAVSDPLLMFCFQTRSPSKAAGMFSGTQEKCATCGKTAYPLEKVGVRYFVIYRHIRLIDRTPIINFDCLARLSFSLVEWGCLVNTCLWSPYKQIKREEKYSHKKLGLIWQVKAVGPQISAVFGNAQLKLLFQKNWNFFFFFLFKIIFLFIFMFSDG
jgi:hypothetical protein